MWWWWWKKSRRCERSLKRNQNSDIKWKEANENFYGALRQSKRDKKTSISLWVQRNARKSLSEIFLARLRQLYRCEGCDKDLQVESIDPRSPSPAAAIVERGSRLSEPSTRRQTIPCRLLLPLPCLWAKNHIMAAKKQRRREEKNFHATKAESTSKHVVLFMLWYFMWKIGSLLMFNRTRFIKLGGVARPARLFPCPRYLEAGVLSARARLLILSRRGPFRENFSHFREVARSSATRNAPQVWRIIDWLSFFFFFSARLYIRTSFIFRYLRKFS